ncbi:major facilitator superfamily transporter [Zopfia rhizophila CBS 207.26]|uniref:Major facilitator superfamily transporter n=1 Tax=Zopfia rhizophila CBS 207.26 TaxID=1314779 RepID=A0A6A6DSZ4_9PEZI|nr:major facilitator superfamily transporter [Zopfia rhizophila CBS 207.26]
MESGILTNAKADGEPKSNRPSVHAENEHVGKKTSSKSSRVDTPAKDETDSNVVDWAGPDDAENPQNWTPFKKWSNIAVLSLITFNVPLASSMFAPGVPQLLEDFGTTNQSLATFVVSVYILGLAAGPIVLAPLSEMYGRVIIYHIGNVLFIIFTIACALSTNMGMLIAFRFLAGLVGAGPIAIGGGTIVDVTNLQQRGTAMSVWTLGPLLGPSVGPIAGGFLAQAAGWRWVFWVLAIVAGVIAVAGLLVLRETHAPTLLARKTKRLQKETGNTQLRSKLASDPPPQGFFFFRSIVRPTKLLVLSPICLLLSIYSAFVYAMIYFMFSTFSFIFEGQYGFGAGVVGLVYIAVGIGMALGVVIQQITGDRVLKHLAAKHNDGKPKPEYRLPPMIGAGLSISVGLVIYGWTAQYEVQWAVPLLGTLIVGVGICITNININTYLVDAFTIYAASALAASTVLRSLFGALFPLFALQLYDALDYGWGNTLLAFIALALWPLSLIFFYYGEKIRTYPKFQVKL